MRTIAGESHAPVPITRLLKLGCAPANNRVLALSSPQDIWNPAKVAHRIKGDDVYVNYDAVKKDAYFIRASGQRHTKRGKDYVFQFAGPSP